MRRLASLYGDARGSALTEFAIVAPVMCLMLVGEFDVAHMLYARATLQGIVQKVARDAGLEASGDAAAQTTLDNKVRAQAKAIANNATITISRRFYRTFAKAAAAAPESWTDTNRDGTCNRSEPYSDANNNSVWDADGGDAGQGGAKDRTVYTVVMTYPHMFPLPKYLSQTGDVSITASTVLENQPYEDQNSYGSATVRYCPA